MESEITTRPIYMRHTGTDGNSYVQDHLVWSAKDRNGAEALIEDLQHNAAVANARAIEGTPPKPALGAVQQITPEQYLKEKQ